MFRGLAAFFETYSITKTDAKNKDLRPIDVSCVIDDCIPRVKDVLKRFGYDEFIDEENFKEIFAKTEKFEVTVSFVRLENGGTRIGMAVFSPRHKLTKKILIGLMKHVTEEFEDQRIQ